MGFSLRFSPILINFIKYRQREKEKESEGLKTKKRIKVRT